MAFVRYSAGGDASPEYAVPKILALLSPAATYEDGIVCIPCPSGMSIVNDLRNVSQLVNAMDAYGIPVYCVVVNRSGETEMLRAHPANLAK